MAQNLHITIDDKAVRRALNVAPEQVVNTMHVSLQRSAVYAQRMFRTNITDNGSVHTGELRRSVEFKFENKLAVNIRPMAKYAPFVEYGTRPHWTSVRNLERWAKFRGINAYALQRSIAMHGTKPHPYEEKTFKQVQPYAIRNMQQSLNRVVKEIL